MFNTSSVIRTLRSSEDASRLIRPLMQSSHAYMDTGDGSSSESEYHNPIS